jgi:2,4-dienoyl-CoA reductase-like NADH-dependent reductase (Old Yellow Enzyme family)
MANESDAPLLFTPVVLGRLTLKNRIIRAGAFEGMCADGLPSAALLEHHRTIARGGAAMTTVAYCSVSQDGRTYGTQMVMTEEVAGELAQLTAAVHAEGALAALQLGHCGDFANPRAIGGRPLGPRTRFNTYALALSRAMDETDIHRVITDFGRAATLAVQAGFDAIELHYGHGYLLSQFLSPYTNRRSDAWGGDLEGRMRLPLAVATEVRRAVGPTMTLLAKLNLSDGFAEGISIDEALQVGQALGARGIDALVTSGGFVSKTPFYMLRGELPVAEMVAAQKSLLVKLGLYCFGHMLVPTHRYTEAFFRPEGERLLDAVDIPVILLGGLKARGTMESALQRGFAALQVGRALVHDPYFPKKLQSGELDASPCEPCNKCVAEMDKGGVRCVRADAYVAPPVRDDSGDELVTQDEEVVRARAV